MKQLSEKLQDILGPHTIQLNSTDLPSGSEENNIFIFNFTVLTEHLQNALSSHTCELCGYNPLSLDIVWVDGQDELLNDDLDSFWFWRENGLIPFALVGNGAENGPFSDHEGVLFLNQNSENDINKMPIVLLRVEEENVKLSQIASTFDDLKITKTIGNHDLSEEIKNEGNALIGDGDFDGAAEKYFKSFQADPTNPTPYNNLGIVTQMSRDHADRGELFFQMAFLVDPQNTNAMRGYSSLLAERTIFDIAIEVMELCKDLETNILNYILLAQLYIDTNKNEKAEEMLKIATDLDENHPGVQKVMDLLADA